MIFESQHDCFGGSEIMGEDALILSHGRRLSESESLPRDAWVFRINLFGCLCSNEWSQAILSNASSEGDGLLRCHAILPLMLTALPYSAYISTIGRDFRKLVFGGV